MSVCFVLYKMIEAKKIKEKAMRKSFLALLIILQRMVQLWTRWTVNCWEMTNQFSLHITKELCLWSYLGEAADWVCMNLSHSCYVPFNGV